MIVLLCFHIKLSYDATVNMVVHVIIDGQDVFCAGLWLKIKGVMAWLHQGKMDFSCGIHFI